MSSTNSIAASVIAGLVGGLAGAALYQHLAKPANKKIATKKASPAGGHYRYTSCFILFIRLRLEFLFLFFPFFFLSLSLTHSLNHIVTLTLCTAKQPLRMVLLRSQVFFQSHLLVTSLLINPLQNKSNVYLQILMQF